MSVRVCALRLCRSLLPPVSPDLLDLATEKLLDGDQSNGFALTMMHSIGATLNVWGRVMQGRYPL